MSNNIYICICEQLTNKFINSFLYSTCIKGNVLYIQYKIKNNIEYTEFEQYAFKHKKFNSYTNNKGIIEMNFIVD